MRLTPDSESVIPSLFVTFEGIDFSGKSVQCKLLFDNLKLSADVILVRDPGTTKISEKIRTLLLSNENMEMSPWTELLLYEAARAQMVEESILPALRAGKMVLCDRFYDSTTAYQGYGRELNLEIVHQANRIGACGLVPDLTILLDVEPEMAMKRKKRAYLHDRLESQGIDFQRKVRNGYLTIAKNDSRRVHIIDGQRDIDSVQFEIITLLQSHLRIKL